MRSPFNDLEKSNNTEVQAIIDERNKPIELSRIKEIYFKQKLLHTNTKSDDLLKEIVELWTSDGDELPIIVWANFLNKIKEYLDKNEKGEK